MQQLNDLINEKNNKLYSKLFKLIEVIETVPSKDWAALHMLAYIMKSYKQKFNADAPKIEPKPKN